MLLAALLLAVGETAFADGTVVSGIRQINPTTVEITYSDGGVMTVDFYGKNVFRLFRDPKGGIVRDPSSTPPAQILVDNPRKDAGQLSINASDADGGRVYCRATCAFRPQHRTHDCHRPPQW